MGDSVELSQPAEEFMSLEPVWGLDVPAFQKGEQDQRFTGVLLQDRTRAIAEGSRVRVVIAHEAVYDRQLEAHGFGGSVLVEAEDDACLGGRDEEIRLYGACRQRFGVD